MRRRVPRLTAEELSRVLSQAAVGKLDHFDVADWDGRSCVAGAVYALYPHSSHMLTPKENKRLWQISNSLDEIASYEWHYNYGGDPDSVLRTLEAAGLAAKVRA